jgi:hypothetical protein
MMTKKSGLDLKPEHGAEGCVLPRTMHRQESCAQEFQHACNSVAPMDPVLVFGLPFFKRGPRERGC